MALVTAVHLAELALTAGFRASSAHRMQARATIGAGPVHVSHKVAFGTMPNREKRTNPMLSKFTVALLATTLLAAPVLAQSTISARQAPATQAVITPTIKANVNAAAKPASANAHKAIKASKVKKHKVKKLKVTKHAKRAVHATAKPAMPVPHY